MRKLLITLLMLAAAGAFAQVEVNQEPLVFDSPQQQDRFNAMTAELRCLVCQNQNLADSDAPLAHQLRDEIYGMMKAGRSDDEIKSFLVERYGDFVLYRPPVKGNTLVLWLAPAILLAGGAVAVAASVRKRQRLLLDADGEEQA